MRAKAHTQYTYLYVYIYIYLFFCFCFIWYIHTYMHTSIHTSIYEYIHMYTHIYMYIYTHTAPSSSLNAKLSGSTFTNICLRTFGLRGLRNLHAHPESAHMKIFKTLRLHSGSSCEPEATSNTNNSGRLYGVWASSYTRLRWVISEPHWKRTIILPVVSLWDL